MSTQRRNHELAALLQQHSSVNSTLMNQIEDLVRETLVHLSVHCRPGRCRVIPEILKFVLKCPEIGVRS